MAKKFIEFIEAVALIILTAVLVVGVYKYIDTSDNEKEENPVVDVEPGGDELPGEDNGTEEEPVIITATVYYQGEIADFDGISTIQYEEGMTWAEWVESEYNKFGFYIHDLDGAVFSTYSVSPYKSTDIMTGTEIELCGI